MNQDSGMKLTSLAAAGLLLIGLLLAALVLVPQLAQAAQFGRPDSDVTDGGWEDTTGGDGDGANWDEIDEATADDGTTYIRADSAATYAEVGLSDVTDPVSSSGHILRFRAYATGSGGPEKLRIQLYQGTTQIAQGPNEVITRGSWNTYSYTLTGTEADAITDYTDLRLRFVPSMKSGETIDVTWAELEVPDVSAATCEDLTVVITNPSGQLFFNATTDTPPGGLWQEENVSEDYQAQLSTSAVNVTNDDTVGVCDVTLELLTSPGAGRTMKFNTTSTAPNPGVNSVPVGSNVTVVSGLGIGATQAIWLWIDLADSQGGQATPTLRVDTKTASQ